MHYRINTTRAIVANCRKDVIAFLRATAHCEGDADEYALVERFATEYNRVQSGVRRHTKQPRIFTAYFAFVKDEISRNHARGVLGNVRVTRAFTKWIEVLK